MPLSSAERIAAYRARLCQAGKPDPTQAWRRRPETRRTYRQRSKAARKLLASVVPFCGCDGEGAGEDAQGRQNYVLFRMGERELYADGRRLETEELLDFICDHPANEILVGFAFGYDVTMILRDLPHVQQQRLFKPRVFGAGHSPFVWYRDFDVEYLPRQYLRVRRVRVVRNPDGTEKRIPVRGSTRTIFETFGFFQKSFFKVLKEFGVGTEEELALILASKERRGADDWKISDEERAYCALECAFLAQLMHKLRDYCYQADIRPRSWNGAGKLASALHKAHDTPTAKRLAEIVPREVNDLANMAYYGGRFEITRTGAIHDPVEEYDIRSAYPDAMRRLPCLLHGTWREASAGELRKLEAQGPDALYVAACRFRHEVRDGGFGQLGGLPVRSKEGHLYWPAEGSGVYWSPEIRSAVQLGCSVTLRGGWILNRNCDCTPFDWVEPLFDYRRSIGSSGPGYPIKLGINSLYGKTAQRKGNGVYANMIWAGLITALTRAKLNAAIALSPSSVVMLATDAVYSTEPLDLDVGERLGQWEHQTLDGLFIVQPGLYWCPAKRKRKSRGLSGKFFEEPGRTEAFEYAWSDYLAAVNSNLDSAFPSVDVPVPGFVGLRLALARGKPDTAGTWISDSRSISFDFRNKRLGHMVRDGHIVTGMIPGGPRTVSLPHRDFLASGGAEPWENARLMLEEQPDYIDLGPPFED